MTKHLLETQDLLLKKCEFDDWEDLYRNIWRHEESAKYMLWKIITSEEAAKERMRKCVTAQEMSPYNWTVYEKKSSQAIGWAVMEEVEHGVFEDQGIAIGPAFVGKGYGKQIVNAVVDFACEKLDAKKMIFSCRSGNIVVRKMLETCGFVYSHSEEKIDPRDEKPYEVVYMVKMLSGAASV